MSAIPERAITRHKFQQLVSRAVQTSKFKKETILELKGDTTATGQAIAVLLLVGLCYGLGFNILDGLQKQDITADQLISGTLSSLIFTDFSVFVWSATVFLVGTRLFQGKTGYWELARPLFFSIAPGVLFLLVAIPFRPLIVATAVVASSWIVSIEFVTLKTTMGFNTQRALLTSAVGLLLLIFIQMTIGRA